MERYVQRTEAGAYEWTEWANEIAKKDPDVIGQLARELIWKYEESRLGQKDGDGV